MSEMQQQDGVMTALGKAAAPATVEAWLDSRPSWLRAAAQALLSSGAIPDEAGIDVLADHCQAEAAATLSVPHRPIVEGAIQASPTGPKLTISKLFKIRGVNAFGQRAELDLSHGQLTVVYGANGAGKSGYARLLKQMCGARAAETIHGNVFAASMEPVSAVCRCIVTGVKDGQSFSEEKEYAWKASDGALKPLASVHVFDSATAVQLGQTPSTATHLPRAMRFVNLLIGISDRVAGRLRERAQALPSTLPVMPSEFAGTKAALFLQALTASTTIHAVNEGCQFTNSEQAERLGLEAALAQADPATAHAKAVSDLIRVAEVGTGVMTWAATFGDELAQSLAQARTNVAASRKAAQDYAHNFFAGLPLSGVGEATWRRLWTAAAEYAQALAYPGHVHPNVEAGARCVLCQQPLEADAKKRMSDFANYVGNQLQAEATAAEKALADLVAIIPNSPQPDYWLSVAASIGMTPEDGTHLEQQVEQRLVAMRGGDPKAQPPVVDWTQFQNSVAQTKAALIAQRDALAVLMDPAGRQQKQAQLVELRAKEWVSKICDQVLAEVERKRRLSLLDDAGRLAQTHALTKFSNEIGKAELAGGFAERFNKELERLGGRSIPVRLAHKLEGKGVLTFSIGLDGATGKVKSREVLSEGEQRVVALAAFLADVTGTDRSLPVIFDDPISSLDQRFEEAVAARLVDLATARQVIVFTHRLSMSVLIEHVADKQEAVCPIAVDVVAIDRKGAEAGVPATIKVFSQSPKKGLNDLDGKVRSAMKLDDDQREDLIKAACGNFRILVERTVEDHLCAKVVVRYRREINTKGLLSRLTVISKEDCLLINQMMTKYSAFEHAQPVDTPLTQIDPNDLLADIAKMVEWIKEFDKRASSA